MTKIDKKRQKKEGTLFLFKFEFIYILIRDYRDAESTRYCKKTDFIVSKLLGFTSKSQNSSWPAVVLLLLA